MGKKKPFIDRKNASTYHLMHRSQRDVSQHLQDGDVNSAGMILWPSPNNDPQTNAHVLGTSNSEVMKEWRDRLQRAGLLEEADTQDMYLKEISGTGTFLDTSGRVANASEGDWRATKTTAQDLDLLEVKGQLDNIPLAEALDDEMAAMLYGDVDLDDFEELNDEFVFDAAREPEDAGNAFDYDEHIRKLMEKARKERQGGEYSDKNNAWAKQDADFFSRMKPLHERDDEDDDSFADVGSEMGGTNAHTVMTTPGVVPKLSPDEERALCDKFAQTLLEYDSDEIGDDPYEEIGGDRPLEGDRVLEAALDDFLEEKQDEILIHGNREGRKGGSGYAVLVGKHMVPAKDLDPADDDPTEKPPVQEILAQAQVRLTEPHVRPPEEDVLIDGKSYFSEKIRNPWDCESIISTYSNLDNNPVTIGPGGGRRRKQRKDKKKADPNEPVQQIQLSNKTGLPLGVFNSRNNDDDDDVDEEESNYYDGNTAMSVNRGLARKKDETAEEKRIRKAALKQERQISRIQKKLTREIFQEEFTKRSIPLQADDVAGKTVFRYS